MVHVESMSMPTFSAGKTKKTKTTNMTVCYPFGERFYKMQTMRSKRFHTPITFIEGDEVTCESILNI